MVALEMSEPRRNHESLAEFLSAHLQEYGGQSKFSQLTGISQSSVSRWQSGTGKPTFEACFVIARYFNIDPYEVFEMVGNAEFAEMASRLGVPGCPPANPAELYFDPRLREAHRRLDRAIAAGLSSKAEAALEEASRIIETTQKSIGETIAAAKVDGIRISLRGKVVAEGGKTEGEPSGEMADSDFSGAVMEWWGAARTEAARTKLESLVLVSGARLKPVDPAPREKQQP